VYFALFVEHKLAAGERGMVLVLAATQDQARVTFGYVEAFLRGSPVLTREVASTTRSEIRLKNGVIIAVHANSFRSIRGRTLFACVCDEVAYWRDDSTASPDTEVYTAVLPSLLTTRGMLVGISSPYRRAGLLHGKHKQFFAVDSDDTLVVVGGSKVFNPTLDDAAIAVQREADPAAAASEWDATFRDDISGFLDDALIDGAVDHGRPLELPPRPKFRYTGFTDPSGGRGDAFTLCVGHREGEKFVADVLRARTPPVDPGIVVREFSPLLKDYAVREVRGDAYASEWCAEAFRAAGIRYLTADRPKSVLYLESLPLWARGLISIPDHPRLLRELRLLERRTHRSGKDTVDHGRSGHDDLANALCGCAAHAVADDKDRYYASLRWVRSDEDCPHVRHEAGVNLVEIPRPPLAAHPSFGR